MKKRSFEIEAEVFDADTRCRKLLSFEVIASSFKEAVKMAEEQAPESYYESGGYGQDPQIITLSVDGENV